MMYHSTCSFKCLPYLLILGCILTFLQACAPVQRYVLLSSDNGDGTYTNPVINADYPDPDIIRVGEDYYMVSSSFVAMPGLPVCHSKDLINWQIIGWKMRKRLIAVCAGPLPSDMMKAFII